MITRRRTIGFLAAGISACTAMPRFAFGAAETNKRLVVVLLRGAMDGLSAVPAYGDPDFATARGGLALPPPGQAGGALKLDAMFGLHPNLQGLAGLYSQNELLVVHAAATPYRDRSHFDGQNLLESGAEKPFGLDTGWLNRALMQLPASDKPLGIALSSHMPLMMRGAATVNSWSPSTLPPPNADTVSRLAALYRATDPTLAANFANAQTANSIAAVNGGGKLQPFVIMAGAAAKFLAEPEGPRIAMIEFDGWDTHINQAGPFSPLSTNLLQLDRGLIALKDGLGPVWKDTAVIVVSEFGRTVAMNGTRGTDHGTGSAFFVMGGAVNGGRVIADWPGLKPAQLLVGRDLKPTTDFRAIANGVLRDHMGISEAKLAAVFPSSASIRPVGGLLRA